MTFFVKHPPVDGLPPTGRKNRDLFTLGDTRTHQVAKRAIEQCEARFDETGNPIEAINAFMYANNAGLYPPLWVLEFIGMRFLKASKGVRLDRAFGFAASGKGKRTPPAQRQRMDARNFMWCMSFFKLEAAGLTRSSAATAIAALWQERTGKTLSGAAVLKAVKTVESDYAAERALTFAAAEAWTVEDRRELLRPFGRVNVPRNIRKLYGL